MAYSDMFDSNGQIRKMVAGASLAMGSRGITIGNCARKKSGMEIACDVASLIVNRHGQKVDGLVILPGTDALCIGAELEVGSEGFKRLHAAVARAYASEQ